MYKLFVLLLVALAAVVNASEDVVVLSGDDFASKTASGEWLVKFYAPWCGHCKKLAPTWDELATKAKGDFNVAKIDCTEEGNKATCSEFGVRGYPTVKYINAGASAVDYRGARTIDDFTKFVENQRNPAPKETKEVKPVSGEPAKEGDVVILTDADFKARTQEGTWLVKFYAPWCGHCKRLAPTWDELATKVKGTYNIAKVDCTVEKDTCGEFGIRGYPTVKKFVAGEPSDFKGQRTIEDFEKFLAN